MTELPKRAPLEEVMVAMDVVDTLRHREKFVARELDTEGRQDRLITRLREIYAAQGIEVTDAVLKEGVRALEEDRFAYTPPPDTMATRFARIYVLRGVWAKPFLATVCICLLGWVVYYFALVRPEVTRQAEFPEKLLSSFNEIKTLSIDPTATRDSQTFLEYGQIAFEKGKYDDAEGYHKQLQNILAQLQGSYRVMIVARPGEQSGVWRIPDINTNARNYYLILEAVGKDGKVITLPITSEETGKTHMVTRWGLRVDQRVFEMVAADKKDDGIIQKRLVGEKVRGKMKPTYTINTEGGAITEW